MGLVDSIAIDDAVLAFSDSDTFAETVTYTKTTAVTRSVKGVVERPSPEPGPAQSGHLLPLMRITLPNSTTYGVTAAEWVNGDTITVAYRRGGNAAAYRMHLPRQSESDAGMTVWELR
jgi:endonuclease YncB( thermonuclease family)